MAFFSNRIRNEILENYKKIKKSSFDFERIAYYFINKDDKDAHQILTGRTLQDIDFEELFMLLDRTCSVPGQQYFYSVLRTIPREIKEIIRFESTIDFLKNNPKSRELAVLQLSRLIKPGAFYIQGLIFKSNIKKPGWFWLIPILSNLAVALLIISIVDPVMVLALLPVMAVNFVIHLWNKRNMLTYSNSIPQLIILNQVASNLLKSRVFQDKTSKIREANEVISQICRSAIFFRVESKLKSEIGQFIDSILELIKASFLLEPLALFRMIKQLDSKKEELKVVFDAIGHLDVANSILSLRETLPYYCIPRFIEKSKELVADELYHPLILEPVSNSVALEKGKSVLISGSNMSGKTTFIRTIGINAILAQTLNLVCAKKFEIPQIKVHTAIKISDNLMDETSYYYEEVKTINRMISESNTDEQNLFLLDEIFKGTNTVERIAAGKSVLSFLNQKENMVFVSTHDLELTELLSPDFENYHFTESIENDQLKFDYKLKMGKLIHTNAIRILELNGFPKEITGEAKNLAGQLRNQKVKEKKNYDIKKDSK